MENLTPEYYQLRELRMEVAEVKRQILEMKNILVSTTKQNELIFKLNSNRRLNAKKKIIQQD